MSCLAINSNKSRQSCLSDGPCVILLHPCVFQRRTFCQVRKVKLISLKIEDIFSGVAAIPKVTLFKKGLPTAAQLVGATQDPSEAISKTTGPSDADTKVLSTHQHISCIEHCPLAEPTRHCAHCCCFTFKSDISALFVIALASFGSDASVLSG